MWNPQDIETASDTRPVSYKHGGRRLTDKILAVFHSACDAREFDVAKQLLVTLEDLNTRQADRSPETERRKSIESLVGAHQRLWQLKNVANPSE